MSNKVKILKKKKSIKLMRKISITWWRNIQGFYLFISFFLFLFLVEVGGGGGGGEETRLVTEKRSSHNLQSDLLVSTLISIILLDFAIFTNQDKRFC